MSCRGERREQVVGHSAQHMLGVNEIFLELQLPNHWLIFFFETRSYYIAQVDLEF
jgi:hypothetical protein